MGGVRRLEQDLAAHPQVHHQRGALGSRTLGARQVVLGGHAVQHHPEELAAPGDLTHPRAHEPDREVLRAGHVATHRPGMEHVGRPHGRADRPAGQPPPNDLDLGQLGHVATGRSQPETEVAPSSRARSSASSAVKAAEAASCSASFLLRPLPSPRACPATLATAWKSLA